MLFQIKLLPIPEKAVTALMNAIKEKNKHNEVMKAINDAGQLDDTTVRKSELNTVWELLDVLVNLRCRKLERITLHQSSEVDLSGCEAKSDRVEYISKCPGEVFCTSAFSMCMYVLILHDKSFCLILLILSIHVPQKIIVSCCNISCGCSDLSIGYAFRIAMFLATKQPVYSNTILLLSCHENRLFPFLGLRIVTTATNLNVCTVNASSLGLS